MEGNSLSSISSEVSKSVSHSEINEEFEEEKIIEEEEVMVVERVQLEMQTVFP